MEWTRSETIALAKDTCTQCHGLGLLLSRKGTLHACNCVLRNIFRACYAHFRYCAKKEKFMSRISLEVTPGRRGTLTWGHKDEEYMADFVLIARRTLTEEEQRVFKYHFLLGADYRLCCRKLHIERGNFFHVVYRIEQKLGRVFRELEPYSLYPVDEYYNGERRRCTATSAPPAKSVVMPPVRARNLRISLLRSA